MIAVFSTILLDIYLLMLSLQLNGILKATDSQRLIVFIFLVLFSAAVFLLNLPTVELRKNTLTPTAICYLFYFFCLLLIGQNQAYDLSYLLQFIFFPLVVIITNITYRRYISSKIFETILDIQFYVSLIFSVIFIFAQIVRDDYENTVNTVYYCVFTLPFVMSNRNRTKRIIGMFTIVFCVFWSAKRAALIALVLVFLFVGKKYDRATIIHLIKRGVPVIIILLVGNFLLKRYFDVDFIGRILSLATDGGSGRVDLTAATVEQLRLSNMTQLLFGHNLEATSMGVQALGAHNDLLEVIYRIGLVGCCIYVCYFTGIYKYAKLCRVQDKDRQANMLFITLFLFVVISLFSQLIFVPSYAAFVPMSFNLARFKRD